MSESPSDASNMLTGIEWRMSAALEDVPRNGEEFAEVTSLEQAVRAWIALDPELQGRARLTPERPINLDGAQTAMFTGQAIAMLARRLPDLSQA